MFEGANSYCSNVKYRFGSFWYNFRWDDYVTLFEGPLSKAFAIVPIFAYLIIFNDALLDQFGFSELIGAEDSSYFLEDGSRLRFAYFGLIFLGLGQLLFIWRRPFVLKQAKSQSEYIAFVQSVFTPRDFIEVYGRIESHGHTTLYGNDELRQWESFKQQITDHTIVNYSYKAAIEKFSGLVRCLAIDHYVTYVKTRKTWLLVSLIMVLAGYALLSIPSIDLFFRVVESVFS
ncbi:hypothetical protein [Sulfitobacter dubius]|uniref:hypothetical protein n=1 Tax=Sulfitobacter dubius TaxID=218673 RepID=UPI0022AE9065|nr:hypothetical protein [Sulfitobacter dubius]MCZ4367608.1 hypothetical protein [Sulfitobacter dubius]